MTQTSVSATNSWLKSRHILVPGDWLEACVEWIIEENQGVRLSQTQLNGLVFEQWLLADLREIGSKCLPDQIASTQKFQLNGVFALQVDSMVDVGKPYYGQLQKVQGSESRNVEVTAEPAPPWEPKPTRMMMLTMTDGDITVQGMEYKPISCLSGQMKPGCKVLVKGSVLCRRGILMLMTDNVTVLGGEVDALVETNTPVNSLKQAMEQSLQFSGKDYHQEFSGDGIVTSKNKKLKTEFQSQKIKTEVPSQPQQNKPLAVPRPTSGPAPKQEAIKVEDEWEDDIIGLEGLMEDMDDFEMDSVPPPPPPPNFSTQQNSRQPKPVSHSSGPLPMNTASSAVQQSAVHSRSSLGVGPQSIKSSSISGKSKSSLENENQKTKGSVDLPSGFQSAKQKHSENAAGTLNNGAGQIAATSCQSKLKTKLGLEKKSLQKVDTNDKQFSDEEFLDDLDDFDLSAVDDGVEKQSLLCGSSNSGRAKENTCIQNDISKTQNPLLPVQKKKLFMSPKSSEGLVKKEMSDCILINTSQEQPSSSVLQTQISKLLEKKKPLESKRSEEPVVIAITSPLKSAATSAGCSTKITELLPESEPFTYLAFVKKKMPVSQPIRFHTKAYVSTLTDKLRRIGGVRWQLPCKINDGSEVMDVNLSNQVLTKLIGFSVPETMEMRHLKPDSFLMKKLNKGIKDCQQSLINLLAVMELVVSPGAEKPEILSLRDVSDQDILLLQSRVSRALSQIDS
uniref:RecQ-mediated genome instability protein 1 n=1 Tax=Magallana gigas TaxID=29159 RepID=K1PXT4_MAGGI|eukprot:XP_011431787.2 PREDICTED: recQ-mediated genome instability protein 1-like [Crassostrea gigas]